MKIAGIILLILGILSLLGAVLGETSAFGPIFFIALGVFLIHKSNNKKDNVPDKQKKQVDNLNSSNLYENMNSTPVSIENVIQEDDIQPITQLQKEASFCLIIFFAGFNKDYANVAPLIQQAADYLDISNTDANVGQLLDTYTDPNEVIDAVLTIKNIQAKEKLLAFFYKLAKNSDRAEAIDIAINIAQDMGYDKRMLWQLVK